MVTLNINRVRFRSSKQALTLSLVLATGLLSAAAGASPDDESAERTRYNSPAPRYGSVVTTRYNNQDQYTDYAEVLNVTPLYRQVRVSIPERQCWDENVVNRQPEPYYGGYQSYTPQIIGGVAGGVVGNQFGKGTGNTLMTVAGALLGGSIGRDVSHQNRRYQQRGYSYTTTETRCETRNSYRTEEREDGYQVRYRYNGRTYTTRMDSDPGDTIRVKVQVVPKY